MLPTVLLTMAAAVCAVLPAASAACESTRIRACARPRQPQIQPAADIIRPAAGSRSHSRH